MIKVNKLRGLIVEQYGTIGKFSMSTGISSTNLTNMLNGKGNPSLKLLKKIYDALDVSYEEFIDIFYGLKVK